MDASITFSTPLGDDLNNVSVMPEDFRFYVPGFPEVTQTPANSIPSLPGAFDVSTNASGQIVNWDIFVEGDFDLFYYDTFNRSASCRTCAPFADDSFFGYSGEGISSNMDNPGTWTVSTTGTNVPEPSSALLLGVALLGVSGLALKKKLTLRSITSASCFCLLMTFCAVSGKADTTYTYTGQQLTDVELVGCDPTPCILTGTNFSIVGSITVASPLAPNLNDAVVNFTSFAFSSEGLTDTSADEEHLLAELGGGPFPLPGLFNVSTNAAGQIIKWDISLVGTNLGPPFLSLATGFGLFDCPNPHFCDPIADGDSVDNGSNETSASNQGHPGTWSMSTTGTTVPEPTSGTLLIAGLVGLAGLALKRAI